MAIERPWTNFLWGGFCNWFDYAEACAWASPTDASQPTPIYRQPWYWIEPDSDIQRAQMERL